jgi:hypothetical protein
MLSDFGDLIELKPANEMQSNIAYAAKLYSVDQMIDWVLKSKSKKEKLEEQLLQRQLDAMGSKPSTLDFNQAVLAGRQIPAAGGFLADLFKAKSTFEYLPPSMANVIPIGRNSIKSAILRAVK